MSNITPPPELVQQLCDKAILHAVDGAKRGEIEVWLIQEAFRAGADQELEACCEWLDRNNQWARCDIDELRDGRRPKPPSLKQEALRGLEQLAERLEENRVPADLAVLRRALEALPE